MQDRQKVAAKVVDYLMYYQDYALCFSLHEHSKLSSLGWKQEKASSLFFQSGILPVYLGIDTDVTCREGILSTIKWTRPSPQF